MSETTSPTSSPPGAGGDLPAPLPEGAVTATPASGDYRDQLASRRWNAAPLRNPEVDKTDPRVAVVAVLILAVLTLLVLVVGYASGFWELPAGGAASGAVAALELLA